MATLTYTARAEEDLIDIWNYIAPDNTKAADRLLEKIDYTCHLLAEYPHMGPLRNDIAKELRYHPFGNYLILYREMKSGVEIVRVLHAARYLEG